jgi:hypothetical protein
MDQDGGWKKMNDRINEYDGEWNEVEDGTRWRMEQERG